MPAPTPGFPSYMASSLISLNFLGISWLVSDEGKEEDLTHQGTDCTLIWRLRCNWTDRGTLAQAILGNSSNIGGSSLIIKPMPHPDFPFYVAKRIRTRPDGQAYLGSNGTIAFERAFLEIQFGVPQCRFADGSFDAQNLGELEIDLSSNSIPLDASTSAFVWSSGGAGDVPSKQLNVWKFTTLIITQRMYSRAIFNATLAASLIDFTNSSTMFGFPAETVIFRGGRTTRKYTTSGLENQDVECVWEVHPISGGWNKLPRTVGGTTSWQSYTLKGGAKQFPTANLFAIFTP